MLILKKEKQDIEFPRHLPFKDDETIKLTFINKLTHKYTEYQVVNVSKYPMLYCFEGIDLSTLDEGEYEYVIKNDVITDLGMALIGNYNEKNKIEYNGNKETIQYEG